MAQQTTTPPGGRRAPGGNPNQNQNSSKLLIRSNYDITFGVGNTYALDIEVELFQHGQPVADQEITLKEGISIIDTARTDAQGLAVLRSKGVQSDQEKIETMRINLTGKPDEKVLTVKIPAIKKPVSPTKKSITVRPFVIADTKGSTFEVTLECLVEDEGKPYDGANVEFKEGAGLLDAKAAGNDGKVIFKTGGNLTSVEKSLIYRLGLKGTKDEVEVAVTVPAAEPKPKTDNDPETMTISRYHESSGNFKVLIRVLKVGGVGFKTKVRTWYKGNLDEIETAEDGIVLYDVPGLVNSGESFLLTAFVSGIEEGAKIKLAVRKTRPPFTAPGWVGKIKNKFIQKWFANPKWTPFNNNGRARILCVAVWVALVLALFVGPGSGLINDRTMRQDNGLSKPEQIANWAARQVYLYDQNIPPDKFFAVHEEHGNWQKWFWKLFTVLALIALVYTPLAFREEFHDWIEDKIHKMVEHDSSRASDPIFERLAKWVGMFHTVRRSVPAPVVIMEGGQIAPGSQPAAGQPANMIKHHSLGQMFTMDLLSDSIIAFMTGLFRKAR